tara:strand:+ start:1375 stop:2871 length:1497 start_codon:yes stop_codon:yes gene_type:complete
MKIHKVVLLFLFILTLVIRLNFAFSTEYFSSDESFFILRQVEHIQNTGVPLFSDDLSFGGRTFLFNPLYMYILAAISFVFPLFIVAKILPNVLIASLVFIMYYIVRNTTKSRKVAMFGSVVSTVIPILYVETLNDISVYSLMIPLILVTLYFFIKIRDEEKYGNYCAGAIVILSLINPSVLILVFAFLLYYIFLKVEGLSLIDAEKEVIIFGTIFVVFTQFLIFREALMQHGIFVIFQNIPIQLLSNFFMEFNLLAAIYQIGIIPLLYGVYIVYRYLFREKDFTIYFYISFGFATAILLWFKLIEINLGLMFLGSILLLLFAQRFKLFLDFIHNSKFYKYDTIVLSIMLVSFLITSLLPALALADNTLENTFSEEEIEGFLWLKDNAKDNAVIMGSIEDGHLISYISQKRNVIDSHFFLIKDINQRYEDIKNLFTSFSQTESLGILEKYQADYLILSKHGKERFGIERFGFYNRQCFDIVFKNEDMRIYEVLCEVGEI